MAIGIAVTAAVVSGTALGCIVFNYSKKHLPAHSPNHTDKSVPGLGEWSTGTDVIISNHTEETFELKKAIIQSAKKSIELSPNFAGGVKYRELLDLIDKQMDREKELYVHIIMSEDLLEPADKDMLHTLRVKHTSRFHYLITSRQLLLTPEMHTEENHVKMLVVDGKYFVSGGSGVHDKMVREELPEDLKTQPESVASGLIDKCFRDTDVIGRGDLAQLIRQQFFQLHRIWEFRTTTQDFDRYRPTDDSLTVCKMVDEHEKLRKRVKAKFIVGGPEHRHRNPIALQYAAQITNANRTIKIANLLFNPPAVIKNALRLKQESGIKVVGYFNGTSGKSSAAHYIYALPNRLNYDLLTGAYEYRGVDQLYHKKVALFDDQIAIVGTYNLGIKSADCDYECVFVIDDTQVAADIAEGLNQDAAKSKLLENENLAMVQQGIGHQFKGWVVSGALGNFFG